MHLFVEHLTVIDCAYLCEQHGLVGESWICDVALIGTLDANSMVMDFGHVKKSIKRAIDDWVDHTLLVPTHSPNLKMHGATLTFTFSSHTLTHTSPEQALCRIQTPRITPESVRDYLQTRLMEIMPATVEHVEITLRTEAENAPYYHYVHGLKKHDGNCQRIAHGHRSRIRISKNGMHDEALSKHWANTLAYAYIGTEEDIVSTDETHTHFAYTAPQGAYALSYPTALCHIIKSDSTVECIAEHIAESCKATSPSDNFTVRAYEGVMKGAVAEA